MILRLILLILIIVILCAILFFLTRVLSPAVSEQIKLGDDYIFASIEHKFSKLGDYYDKENVNAQKKAVVLCSCRKQFSKTPEVVNTSGVSCSVIAKEYGSVSDCNYMCIGKGDCVYACPQKAIIIKNSTAVISDFCIGCGDCVSVCPKGIITLVDKNISKLVLCTNTSQMTTSCSSRQKEENIEEPAKKYFKIWQSCYRMIDAKK